MEQYYLIKGLFNGGFWDDKNNEYRGPIFATKYQFGEGFDITNAIMRAQNAHPCTIIKVYGKI